MVKDALFLRTGKSVLGNYPEDPKVTLKKSGTELALRGFPKMDELEKAAEVLNVESPVKLLSKLLEAESLEEMLKVFEESLKEYGVRSVTYTGDLERLSGRNDEIRIPLESAVSGYLGALIIRGDISPKFLIQFLLILDAFVSLSEGFILERRSRELLESSLDVLATALEKRVKGGEKAKRIRNELFERFGKMLCKSPETLKLALNVYDVGKIGVRDSILAKSNFEMTPEELAEYKKHTIYGYEILKNIDEIPQDILDAVLYHHERMDGSGYPFKLKGSEIPRIAMVVGLFDEYSSRLASGKSKADVLKDLKGRFPSDILKVIEGG